MTLALICSQGDGGWIGVVLEHPIWVVPARLSFGAYLIHPIILNLTVLNQADKVQKQNICCIKFYFPFSHPLFSGVHFSNLNSIMFM
jgi:peptidoglycan/LPS O-acetylase OafA/YrhL